MDVTYKDIVSDELLVGAIENNEMEGFREDFHILHCLIKIHKPKRFLEIGTYQGRGTKIICNARPEMKVCSLDLSPDLSNLSKQYPTPEQIGMLCDLPYTQLLGDSLTFNYGDIVPIDAVFIDGEHDFAHVFYETDELIKLGVKLFIYHDADIKDVWWAITDVFYGEDYDVYRVIDTRMAYAIKR